MRLIVGLLVALTAWSLDPIATFDTGAPTLSSAQARRHHRHRKRHHRRRRHHR